MRLMPFKDCCMSDTPFGHDRVTDETTIDASKICFLQVKTDFNCDTSLVLDTKSAGSASSEAAPSGPVLLLTARPGSQQSSRRKPNDLSTDEGRALPRATASQDCAAAQLPACGKLPPVPAGAQALQAALPAAKLQGGLKELAAAQAPGDGYAPQKVCIPSMGVGVIVQPGHLSHTWCCSAYAWMRSKAVPLCVHSVSLRHEVIAHSEGGEA